MSKYSSESIACWNEILVPKWNRYRHILSGNGKNHSDVAFQYLPIKNGDRILDVGCGYGETCLEMAEQVGSEGEITGVDCTDAFLNIAKQELAESGLDNINYINADAQTHPFEEGSYDLAFSRFGVMFFENRVMALKNIYRSLKPGGKLMLIVWRAIQDNYCWEVGKKVALNYLDEPAKKTITCGPGPFSMADETTTRAMLKSAGFKNVDLFQQINVDAFMGSNLNEAIEFQLQVGPSGELIRESGEKGQELLPQICRALGAELSKYVKDEEVWLPSSSWVIVASKDS